MEQVKITCIALDLDGTTLNPQGRLGRRNREAIERALDAGIQVVAASGRSLDSLPKDILEIKGIQYGITSNGAAVYRLSDRKCLKQSRLSGDSVKEILACTEKEEVVFEAFIKGKPYAQKEYVEDPVSFGATERAIPYIQSTRDPVADMEKFIQENQEMLDCLDIVVKSEEKKRDLWKTLRENVKDVYKLIKPEKINNKNVLIFDDIYTTGSTIMSCAKELEKAHVKKIGILTLAKD